MHQLVGARLADEHRLFVYPVVLGRGRKLFADGDAANPRLANTLPFRAGVVLLTYRPA